MKSVLGRYRTIFWVGAAMQVFIVAIVLLRFLVPTNSLLLWLFDFIIHRIEVLSGVIICLVVIPTVMRVKEIRQQQALARVNIWAEEALIKLTGTSLKGSAAGKMADWEQRLKSLIAESENVLADTRTARNGLKPKVDKVLVNLLKLEESFQSRSGPDALKALLQNTIKAFQDLKTFTSGPHDRSH
jgi:hypothetical protein